MAYEMGVQLADDGQEKRRRKSAIKSKAIKFTKIVSLVGLRHATDSKNSTTRRFIWVAWVVFGVVLAIYQIQERVAYYFDYPSNTNIQIITKVDELRFPQVTICSDNQIIASKARATGVFLTIANVENTMQRLRVYEERNYEEHLKKQTRLMLEKYIEELHNGTQDWPLLSKTLAPTNSAILMVYFDGEKNRSIIEEVVTDLGHCFAFGTNNKPLYTRTPGPLKGLKLILSAPRIEIIPCVRYLSSSKSFPGFRMLIHDPDEIPRMRHSGFTLKPGMNTRVTVELENVTLQGLPYGTCYDQNKTYKASHCFAACEDEEFVKRCGCRDIYMTQNVTYCSYGNIINCSYALQNSASSISSDTCRCHQQCHRRIYKQSSTQSTLPQVLSEEVKAATSNVQVEDLIEATIYYPQLSYRETESVSGYTPFKLFCDVGNALSLLLGATLLTLYEASEFLIMFLGDYWRFRFAK